MSNPAARVLSAVGALVLLACVRPDHAVALSCIDAAKVAETQTALPPGMLLAIGNVESGRIDAEGVRAPWPWTINAAGVGRFFNSSEEAQRAVQTLRAGGIQSIDIGCFQINLVHHPEAFPDLASGFDPLTNALAAARFLVSLRNELGGWESAIAAYHSRTSDLGAQYRDRVLASWRGVPPDVGSSVPPSRSWGIRVWGPGGEITASQSLIFAMPRKMPGQPHVVTRSLM